MKATSRRGRIVAPVVAMFGLLGAGTVALLTSTSASAVTPVTTEQEFRQAWGDDTDVVLGADITLTCQQNAGNGESEAVRPMLGALAANGGPTMTLLPQTGSPLIDGIPNAACRTGTAAGITTDQRGSPRPESAGGAGDIGAVEVQLPAPTPSPAVLITPRFTG